MLPSHCKRVVAGSQTPPSLQTNFPSLRPFDNLRQNDNNTIKLTLMVMKAYIMLEKDVEHFDSGSDILQNLGSIWWISGGFFLVTSI